MSMTLNLVDRLFTMGRHLQAIGRTRDALSLFQRLTRFGELPAAVAEEAQVCLADLHLQQRRFRRARRHLSAALRHRPDSARYHYLMARAVSGADSSDAERAVDHYRRSLELEPNQPECLCSYGHLALHLGRREEGLACLRRAAEQAPDDPETLGRVATGLRRARLADEARGVLRAALFRNPRDARFRRLWDDFQFQQLRREQETARLRRQDAGDDGPVLLPFVRCDTNTPAGQGRKIIRRDKPAPLPPPRGAASKGLPPQRHAQ